MPYVKRDEDGNIIAEFRWPNEDAQEWVDSADITPPPVYTIPRLDFLDRFTPEEVAAIELSTDPEVIYLRKRVDCANVIDLKEDAPAAIDTLIAKGVLDASRRDALLEPKRN